MNRRRFLTVTGLAAANGLMNYMSYLEPNWLETTKKRLNLAGPESKTKFRLLHLADFHYEDNTSLAIIEKAIKLGVATDPDVICLSGDFITKDLVNRSKYIEALQKLAEAAPTYAVLGNHDGGAWSKSIGGLASTDVMLDVLQDAGIIALHNKHAVLPFRGQHITIAGVADPWSKEMNVDQAFRGSPKEVGPKILLCHNPDAKDELRGHDWDLLLAGHTHGGQVMVPWLHYAPILPIGDRKYSHGLRSWGSRWVHITRGIGSSCGIRFACRPEVSVLELEI